MSSKTRGFKKDYSYYDVAVLGDTACGKSSIIERLVSRTFTQTYTPTAAEVYMTTLHEDDKRVACLHLFDTAGGFEFPMMLRLTITKCQAFFVVYSVGSRKSLEVAKRKLEEITAVKGKHFPCVLVGNMTDDAAREVTTDKGLQTAVQHGCAFIETSAKEDVNIEEAFYSLVRRIEFAERKEQIHLKRNHRLTSSLTSVASKMKIRKSSVKKFIVNLSNSFSDSNSSSDSEDSDCN